MMTEVKNSFPISCCFLDVKIMIAVYYNGQRTSILTNFRKCIQFIRTKKLSRSLVLDLESSSENPEITHVAEESFYDNKYTLYIRRKVFHIFFVPYEFVENE